MNITPTITAIKNHLPDGFAPKTAIMLGSGLGGFGDHIDNAVTISYADIPGFPVPSVEGHAGALILGQVSGQDVICFSGRVHFYETGDAEPIKTMIRSAKALGCETLFLTNAAGGLHMDMPPGSIMMITDHINFMGINPLIGHNDDEWGQRFPSMDFAWNPEHQDKLQNVAKTENIPLFEGVYMAFRGPNFETPAEIRMAKAMGADAVGMSTVPECLIAHHCGMSVVGCSVISNYGAGLSDDILGHDHVMDNVAKAGDNMVNLIKGFLT